MKEILIDKVIGSGIFDEGVTASGVRDALGACENEAEIKIIIDSPGGDVFEGVTIFNIIRDFARNHPAATVETYIQGMAASAASFIALAANSIDKRNRIVAEDNSAFMIHNAWSCICGNANDLEAEARLMRRIDTMLNGMYQSRTGKSEEDLRALMDAETWYFGDEIKQAGFCDEIKATAKAKPRAAVIPFVQARVRETLQKVPAAKPDLAALAGVLENLAPESTPEPTAQAEKTQNNYTEKQAQEIALAEYKARERFLTLMEISN